MSYVRADEKTVESLLAGRFGIDEYQREYAWQTKHITELIEDLAGRFRSCYRPEHPRSAVSNYRGYYLGAIIQSQRDGVDYLIDGQQRLTSLTLLLIRLHHLQKQLPERSRSDVSHLIASVIYGEYVFHLDIPERKHCLTRLLDEGQSYEDPDEDESVQNMLARYGDICENLPDDILGSALPYFVDWLRHRVVLVQISTDSDDDAYSIFETMNDRGKSLTPTDIMKGYLLSRVKDRGKRSALNQRWRETMARLGVDAQDGGSDFIKFWLRAKYADTMVSGGRSAAPLDYEQIGSAFHRWLRGHLDMVKLEGSPTGLASEDDFFKFAHDVFPRYVHEYLAIRDAERVQKPGWESVYYNASNNFTLQYLPLLAPIMLSDKPETAEKKIRVVATYLDIWIARRAVNYITLAYSSIDYAIFTVAKRVRDKSLWDVVAELKSDLDSSDINFDSAYGGQRNGLAGFGLNQWSKRYIRYILARLTVYVEANVGAGNHFADYINRGTGVRYDIEHLWADHFAQHARDYPNEESFQQARNRIGGLVLVTRQHNQSYGDRPYEDKVPQYVKQNYLARSLSAECYRGEPCFSAFLQTSGLPFKAYDRFGPAELEERTQLYLELCKRVWSPERLIEAAS